MIRNKRKIPSYQSGNITTTSKYIEFIKNKREPKKIINYKSLLEDKKYFSSFNIFDSTNKNETNLYHEIISTYKDIMNKLDSLMNDLIINNYDYIYSKLINIKNYIDEIIPNKKLLKRNFLSKSALREEKEEYNSCNNLRNSFNDKNILINEIGTMTNKKNSYMNMTLSKFISKNNKLKKIKLLKQKNSDLEDKLKSEKLKYLFCIGEQNIKIKQLEKELNKKSLDNMPKEEIKKYRCFPNYKKIDFFDKYNPNSKTQNKSINTNIIKKDKNYFFEQNENLNKSEKEEVIKNNKEIIECGEKVLNKKELEGNKYINKEGSYFISHPKLKYMKDDLNMKSWKTNELLDSFPKELLRHKFTSKSQKNNIIVFPSSINQIMADLEKLRIHNDFQRIENEFKESMRINK